MSSHAIDVPLRRSRIRATRPHKQHYDRLRDLPRLLPVWPSEIADISYSGRLALLAKLRKALRAERKRGATGHWSYDLGRHAALRNAYRAEVAAALLCRPRLLSDPAIVNGCVVNGGCAFSPDLASPPETRP